MKTNANHEIVSSEVIILGKMDSTEPGTGTPVPILKFPDIAHLWLKIPDAVVDTLQKRIEKCSDRKFTMITLRRGGGSTFSVDTRKYQITSMRGFLELPGQAAVDIRCVDLDIRFSGKNRYVFHLLSPDGESSLYACRGYKKLNIGDSDFLQGSYRLSLFFSIEGGGAFFLLDATSTVPPFFSGAISPTEDFTFFEQLKALSDDSGLCGI